MCFLVGCIVTVLTDGISVSIELERVSSHPADNIGQGPPSK